MPMVPRPMAETQSLVVRSFQVPVVVIPILLLVASPAFCGTGAGTLRASGTCSLSLSGPYHYCRAGLCVRGMLLFQRYTECASPALIFIRAGTSPLTHTRSKCSPILLYSDSSAEEVHDPNGLFL